MPFDQIYWNSGAAFRDTGEFESSGAKDSRIGQTANGNPNSAFSFVGNRRTAILNNAAKIGALGSDPATDRHHEQAYHNIGSGGGEVGNPASATNYSGGAVNSMTNSDIPATAPGGTTLFDCQNRESAHHAGQDVFLQGYTNFFNGIHYDDMLSITTTGKPYKGAYIILKRKKFAYSEFEIGTDQSTLQTNIDDVDGGTISVTNAVIDPRMSQRLPVFTGSVKYKHITVHINGEVVKPTGNKVVANTDLSWIDALSVTQTPTCNISGTTITLNNTFQNLGEHRRYFNTNFQIRIGGTDYNITNVASASISVDSAPGNATNSAFSIVMPIGAPSVGDISHVSDSSLSGAVANTAGWGEFTWGMYSNKHLAGTSTVLFEDTDTYGAKTTPLDIATRSPYYSNKESEEQSIIPNFFYGDFVYSFLMNAYTNTEGDSRYLTIPSESSKAIFPHYNNNLNASPFPSDVNQSNDSDIEAAISEAYGGTVNQYEYFDNILRVCRSHGRANLSPDPSDHNDSLNSARAALRNGAGYPYVGAICGYEDIDVLGSGGTDELFAGAQDDGHFITILDTNRVISPGSTIQVSLQMINGARNADTQEPFLGDLFSSPTVGNDSRNYTRLSKQINEFELFIVAK